MHTPSFQALVSRGAATYLTSRKPFTVEAESSKLASFDLDLFLGGEFLRSVHPLLDLSHLVVRITESCVVIIMNISHMLGTVAGGIMTFAFGPVGFGVGTSVIFGAVLAAFVIGINVSLPLPKARFRGLRVLLLGVALPNGILTEKLPNAKRDTLGEIVAVPDSAEILYGIRNQSDCTLLHVILFPELIAAQLDRKLWLHGNLWTLIGKLPLAPTDVLLLIGITLEEIPSLPSVPIWVLQRAAGRCDMWHQTKESTL